MPINGILFDWFEFPKLWDCSLTPKGNWFLFPTKKALIDTCKNRLEWCNITKQNQMFPFQNKGFVYQKIRQIHLALIELTAVNESPLCEATWVVTLDRSWSLCQTYGNLFPEIYIWFFCQWIMSFILYMYFSLALIGFMMYFIVLF